MKKYIKISTKTQRSRLLGQTDNYGGTILTPIGITAVLETFGLQWDSVIRNTSTLNTCEP